MKNAHRLGVKESKMSREDRLSYGWDSQCRGSTHLSNRSRKTKRANDATALGESHDRSASKDPYLRG